jgi:hypothetical protein
MALMCRQRVRDLDCRSVLLPTLSFCCAVFIASGSALGLNATASAQTVSLTLSSEAWSVDHLSPPSGVHGSSLSSISCLSAKNCYAVGSYYQGDLALAMPGLLNEDLQQHPLIEHFNGKLWNEVAAPKLTGAILGIDCISTTRCFAVGGISHAGASVSTLIEQFNGRVWAVIASQNPGPPPIPTPAPYLSSPPVVANSLNAVSCDSTSDCLAVGSTSVSVLGANWGATVPLSEHFDGSTWRAIPVVNNWQGILMSASCQTLQCSAVGIAVGLPSITYPASGQFVGRYAAGNWRRLNAPEAPEAGISSISCQRSGCVGVGEMQDRPYAARLVSSGWHTLSPHVPAGRQSQFNGVACPTAARCLAVGTVTSKQSRGVVPNLYSPVVETETGNTWSTSRIGVPSSSYYFLTSVTCPSASACIAVGYSQKPSADDSGGASALVMTNFRVSSS